MLPYLSGRSARRDMQREFRGLNRRAGAAENEWTQMTNMTGSQYPLLASRPPRGRARKLTHINGMLGGDRLCFVDGTSFFYDGACYGQVADSPKVLVRMGAQILIFPDKLSFSTVTRSFSPLENHEEATQVQALPMLENGEAPENITAADTAPASPKDGDYWLDTREKQLKRYNAALERWSQVTGTRILLRAPGIGKGFRAGDGIRIRGAESIGLEGTLLLESVDENELTLNGLLDKACTLPGVLYLDRDVPDLVLATELNNRVWGVEKDSQELRACKLGDPTNWQVYAGTSEDSYAVSVGSDGDFTGMCSFLGYALFFKEGWVHKLYGTKPADFQLTATLARGVAKGAAQTLCPVGDTLYYHGTDGVYAYDGSLPVRISWDLDIGARKGICAAEDHGRYVLAAENPLGDAEILVYDPVRALWHREDELRVSCMAQGDGDTWMASTDALWSRNGALMVGQPGGMEMESAVPWRVESADWNQRDAGKRTCTRLLIRASLAPGCELKAALRYDSEKTWHTAAQVTASGKGTLEIPLFPRRCDHFQLALSGVGDAVIYSIARDYLPG